MIHHNPDLFYDISIYNNINEHNQRRTHYLSLILPNYLSIYFRVILKSSFITSSALSSIMTFMSPFF